VELSGGESSRAEVRNSRDSHSLSIEDHFPLFAVRCELLGDRQVLLNRVADVVQRLLFRLTLRGAARQAGDSGTEAFVGLFQGDGVAGFHRFESRTFSLTGRSIPALTGGAVRRPVVEENSCRPVRRSFSAASRIRVYGGGAESRVRLLESKPLAQAEVLLYFCFSE